MSISLKSVVILVFAALLSSCAAPYWQTETIKCAWCNQPIGSYEYYWDMSNHKVARLMPQGNYEMVGSATNMASAQTLMSNYTKSRNITCENGDKDHWFYFCSLRCLNAYKASIGVKEQRFRVINHE